MNPDDQQRRFQQLALPHLGAAFNLARWLTRNDHDAEDVVQEAFVRALRYVGSFRGDNARGWLLQIVRNTSFSWMKENRPAEVVTFDDSNEIIDAMPAPATDEPHAIAVRNADRAELNRAIASLPMAFREVLVLRELEDCSYNDISRIADIPLGTVMSRLARARALVRAALLNDVPRRPKTVLQSVSRFHGSRP
jgi:RNA polymerase sigma-70 factor, ECF subfamily